MPPHPHWLAGPWQAGLVHLCKEQPGKRLQVLCGVVWAFFKPHGVVESDPALNPSPLPLYTQEGTFDQLRDLGKAASPL